MQAPTVGRKQRLLQIEAAYFAHQCDYFAVFNIHLLLIKPTVLYTAPFSHRELHSSSAVRETDIKLISQRMLRTTRRRGSEFSFW